MAVRIALAAGAAAVLIALAVVLSDSGPHQSGTNYAPADGRAALLRGSAEHCAVKQTVPAGTAALRLHVETQGREVPRLDVRVRTARATATTGGRPAGGADGLVTIPLEQVDARVVDARVCIRARPEGTARTVLLGYQGSLVRLEWLREGRESWLGLLPTLTQRFARGKANPLGDLLLPLTALLAVLICVAAGRLVLYSEDG